MPTANTIERLDQARYVEARLEGGLSPIAVAGVAALLTQMDEAVIYPHTPITISVGHGYQATAVTLLNNEWTGCDLTFPFTDNGINNIVGPTTGRYLQQEQSLRMQRAATPTTTPRPTVIEPLPSSSRMAGLTMPSPMQAPPSPATSLLAPSSFAGGRGRESESSAEKMSTDELSEHGDKSAKRPPVDLRKMINERKEAELSARASESQQIVATNSREQALLEEQEAREKEEQELEKLRQEYQDSRDASIERARASLDAERVARTPDDQQATTSRATTSQSNYVPSKVVFTPTPGSKPVERTGPTERKYLQAVRSKTPQRKKAQQSTTTSRRDAREVLNMKRENSRPTETAETAGPYVPPEQRGLGPESPERTPTPVPIPPSLASRDVERLDKEYGIHSENYKQFRKASDRTNSPDRREIMKARIHAKFHNVRENKKKQPSAKPALLEREVTTMEENNSTYLQPLPDGIDLLVANQPARYSYVKKGEDAVTQDPRYGRRLEALLPLAKPEMQATRVLLIMDTTLKANVQYSCLLPDVKLLTMPLATLEEIWEVLEAMFTPRGKQNPEGKCDEVRCPGIVVVGNLIDHLAVTDGLRHLNTITCQDLYNVAVAETVSYATRVKNFKDKMKQRYPEVRLFLTAPPGYESWPLGLRLFVRTLVHTLRVYDVEMILPAPGLRICKNTLRPADLTVPAFFAGLSKLLNGALSGRNTQLTTDDAMAWDYGTAMSDRVREATRSNEAAFLAYGDIAPD